MYSRMNVFKNSILRSPNRTYPEFTPPGIIKQELSGTKRSHGNILWKHCMMGLRWWNEDGESRYRAFFLLPSTEVAVRDHVNFLPDPEMSSTPRTQQAQAVVKLPQAAMTGS